MITRLGKIAQLPKPIRHELNHRLENGKQAPELLAWLNALPETQELIATKFDNQPISRANLSQWRHGGFLEWQADQLRESQIQRLTETGPAPEQIHTAHLLENFTRSVVAEMVADLDALPKLRGQKRSCSLHNLIRDLARLQHGYNHNRRTRLAWTKWTERFLTPDDYRARRDPSPIASATPETPNQKPETPLNLTTPGSQLETPNATPSPSTSVKPDNTGSNDNQSPASEPPKPYPYKRTYPVPASPRSLAGVRPSPAAATLPIQPAAKSTSAPDTESRNTEHATRNPTNPISPATPAPAPASPRSEFPVPRSPDPRPSTLPYDSVSECLRRISLLEARSRALANSPGT
jgi:hypothetical protein